MKKFEEEVKRPSNAGIDPFSKRDVSFEKLSIKFTKGAQTLKEWKEYAFKAEDRIRELESQLDSQQPEIPEFVAEWIEYCKNGKGLFSFLHQDSFYHDGKAKELCKKVREWSYMSEGKLTLMTKAWLNGYTVKEKRFYLKHKSVLIFDPDSDDSDVEELYLGAGGNFVPYKHLAKIFTQSQIDSMETGSYEQILVEEKQ